MKIIEQVLHLVIEDVKAGEIIDTDCKFYDYTKEFEIRAIWRGYPVRDVELIKYTPHKSIKFISKRDYDKLTINIFIK